MATRNGETWLEPQLQSVLGQQGVTLRVRIADDASTDGTAALLHHAAQRDDRIELLDDNTPSGSACANFLRLIRSIDLDSGPDFTHVALCDQDDVWHLGKLRRAALGLAMNRADLYSSAVTALWPSGDSKDLVQCAVPTEADYFFEGAGQGCTFVMSRALFEQVQAVALRAGNLLVSIHYHDWMIYALLRSWNKRWFYDAVPTMLYRQHDSNDTGARGSWAGVRLRSERIRSGWYGQQVRAILTLCAQVSPEHDAATYVQSLMDAARGSRRAQLRWCRFLLDRSRRRTSDRVVLSLFAGLGWL